LAGAIAPLILAYFILDDGDAFVKSLDGLDGIARVAALDGLAHRVIGPYLVMTLILVLLGIAVRYAPLPDVEAEDDTDFLSPMLIVKKYITVSTAHSGGDLPYFSTLALRLLPAIP